MLCRLELGRVGRQKQQVEMVRHTEALRAVPARAIQDEHNLFAGTCSYRLSKSGEFSLEEGHADGCGQVKDGATGGGMDKPTR
jgi:hypothetical protein